MTQKIKVYYREIDAKSIINLDQPAFYREFTSLHRYNQLPELVHKRVNDLYIEQFDAITGHWTDLEASIKESGIMYPCVLSTGIPRLRNPAEIPNYLRLTDSKFWIVCESSGGGRILIAKKLGLIVPCVVNDRVNLYEGQPEMKLQELVQRTHGLKNIDLTDKIGISFPILPKIHMKDEIPEAHYAEERSRVVTGLIADYILPELRNL
jgi:hypothetical protein